MFYYHMRVLKYINFKVAIKTIIVLLSCMLIYHLLILSGIISYQYAWGGRLESKKQMLVFESIGVLITLLIIFVVAIKGNYIKLNIPKILITVLLWFFAAFFALNTLGNLQSINALETLIFTPITIILSLLFIRIAIDKNL